MKHHEDRDTHDPATVHMTIEPEVCSEGVCKRRSKCRYRETDTREKCPVFRRGGGER